MSSTKQGIGLFLSIIALILLFSPLSCHSFLKSAIVINEIAWMGNGENWRDEWIELYNNTDKKINISGWKMSFGDKREVRLEGTIDAHGYFLLERGNDETIPNIGADLIYKNILNNDGLDILLSDEKNNLIDSVECGGGWFEGSNLTKKTMERISPNLGGASVQNWQTSLRTGGTPRALNSQKKISANRATPPAIENKNFKKYDYQDIFAPFFQGSFLALFLTSSAIVYKLKLDKSKKF